MARQYFHMSDWNPELYLNFERERTQPVRDLAVRIEIAEPKRILDIGCGPGNSTAVLKNRWPKARVIGLDNSPAMIEKARKTRSDIEWIQGDAGGDLSPLGLFDIVFANASLQWLPSHSELLPRLLSRLNDGGVLAVQIPKFPDMPIAKAIKKVSKFPAYFPFFSGFKSGMHYFGEPTYYDVLCGLSRTLDMWVTSYYHLLENHSAVIDWVQSTRMRPYLDRLPEERRAGFIAEVLALAKQNYPVRPDGKVLFIFKRFFFVASKA
jgi:trans-aconitate 2-methyltransferase